MAYAMELNDDPNASLGGALSFTVFSVVFVVVAILVFRPLFRRASLVQRNLPRASEAFR